VGLKPVASGAERTHVGRRNADALALAAESSIDLPYHLTNPYCFEPAVAPHLAAAEAGVSIEVARLVDWYRAATSQCEFAVVEGAGGWRVPLHPEGFLSDLPEQLGLGVILVVGLRLGCLNHARLTLEAIERGGRSPFIGWIGNRIEPGFLRLDENLSTVHRLLGSPPLAVIPPLPDPTPARVAEHLAEPALKARLGVVP
jgi:dethiobiotin synthetase